MVFKSCKCNIGDVIFNEIFNVRVQFYTRHISCQFCTMYNRKFWIRVFDLQVLFDAFGCMKKYESELEILKEFYETRIDLYRKRKEYLENQLSAESLKLDNQARFILEKIDGKIVIGWPRP